MSQEGQHVISNPLYQAAVQVCATAHVSKLLGMCCIMMTLLAEQCGVFARTYLPYRVLKIVIATMRRRNLSSLA